MGVICLAGPTASGKTALAVELAKEWNGEVVSCDSMQVYRRMDIGTAKATAGETEGIARPSRPGRRCREFPTI